MLGDLAAPTFSRSQREREYSQKQEKCTYCTHLPKSPKEQPGELQISHSLLPVKIIE